MIQKLAMLASLGALFQEVQEGEAGGSAPKASVAAMTRDKPLSGAVLKAFFEGSDAKKVAERVAAAEGSRLQYLFRTFPNSGVEQVKAAVKEYREAAKKEHGEKSAQEKSARVRGQEVQALYGAFRWANFQPENMGYHSAVTEAREALKKVNVKWDGSRIPEKWERDVRKEVEQQAQVELAARMETRRREEAGEELTEEQQEQIREQAAEQQKKGGMVTLAGALVRKYGTEQAGWLVDALESAIHAAQQQAKDEAIAKKQAAA